MAIGSTILATDYNNIRNKVISILESGAGTRGYGQTAQSSPVFPADPSYVITAAQWNELRNDIATLRLHQTGQLGPIPTISQNQPIRFGASHPNTAFDSIVDQLINDRFNIGSSRFSITAATSADYTSSWSTEASCVLTVTFADANEARYFFNSGGQIRFTSSRTGGSLTSQNNAWTNVLQAAGARSFSGLPTDPVNFYNITNDYVDGEFTLVSATTPYSANFWQVAVKCDVADNSAGTATELTFRVIWRDEYVDIGPPSPGDDVDGTLEIIVEEVKATGAAYPTGSFTITSPTYSISSITAS